MFHFGKKEEKNACCCSGKTVPVKRKEIKECCDTSTDGIHSVQVLGAGCKSCHQQYEYAKEAVKNIGLSVEVEYITDMQKIMESGVMSMPAIMINHQIASMGRVLKTAEVEKLLQKY